MKTLIKLTLAALTLTSSTAVLAANNIPRDGETFCLTFSQYAGTIPKSRSEGVTLQELNALVDKNKDSDNRIVKNMFAYVYMMDFKTSGEAQRAVYSKCKLGDYK